MCKDGTKGINFLTCMQQAYKMLGSRNPKFMVLDMTEISLYRQKSKAMQFLVEVVV